MKHLKTYNERFIPELIDSDGDGSYEVDLDKDGIELSEDTLYEFLDVHFNIQYNPATNSYHAILQYPDTNKEGNEQYIGWVLYGKNIKDIVKKLRFQIKMYVKQFNQH